MNALRVLLVIFLAMLLWTAIPVTNRDTKSLSPAAAEPAVAPLEGRNFVYYVTQQDDTLRSLERKFRVADSNEILELNPGLPSDKLPPGRKIKIPI